MLILTIKFRRAGPALGLHAGIYGERTQIAHNAQPDSPLLRHLDLESADAAAFHVGLADSRQVGGAYLYIYMYV